MVEPAFEDDLWTQTIRFAGENNEDELRDFFGICRYAHLAESDGVNQFHVPLHQGSKSRF